MMSFARPFVFWIAVLAVVIAVIVSLREVLLPFVAGMVLAYLLDPVATRIERLGMNRSLATLIIVTFVIVIFVALLVLTLPVIVHEFANFIESFPRYVRRLQALAIDSDRPWVRKIIGDGLGEAERSVGDLTTLASDWFGAFLRSLWPSSRCSRWRS
jgi:predicted PurR-regulated permease PerM